MSSSFDETMHPRHGDGTFSTKTLAPGTDVDLAPNADQVVLDAGGNKETISSVTRWLEINYLPSSRTRVSEALVATQTIVNDELIDAVTDRLRNHPEPLAVKDVSAYLRMDPQWQNADPNDIKPSEIVEALRQHGRSDAADYVHAIHQRLVTTDSDGTKYRWEAGEADDRYAGVVEYSSRRDADAPGAEITLRIQPGDDSTYNARGYSWAVKDTHDRFSYRGHAQTIEEAQRQAMEEAAYIASGQAFADEYDADVYFAAIDEVIDSNFE